MKKIIGYILAIVMVVSIASTTMGNAKMGGGGFPLTGYSADKEINQNGNANGSQIDGESGFDVGKTGGTSGQESGLANGTNGQGSGLANGNGNELDSESLSQNGNTGNLVSMDEKSNANSGGAVNNGSLSPLGGTAGGKAVTPKSLAINTNPSKTLTSDPVSGYIFANCRSIVIIRGSRDDLTNIYYANDSTKTPIDLGYLGVSGSTAAGYDLSGRAISGGMWGEDSTYDTSITMTGGKVKNIDGGSNNNDLNGSTYITIIGGEVIQIVGGGVAGSVKDTNVTIKGGTITDRVVGGGDKANLGGDHGDVPTVNVTISGGTVNKFYAGGKRGGNVGTANINISGGTFNNNVYGGGIEGGTVTNKTLNVSGNPKIGTNAGTGIVFSEFGAFNINGALAEDVRVNVLFPGGYDVRAGGVIARGSGYSIADADVGQIVLVGVATNFTSGSRTDFYRAKLKSDNTVITGAVLSADNSNSNIYTLGLPLELKRAPSNAARTNLYVNGTTAPFDLTGFIGGYDVNKGYDLSAYNIYGGNNAAVSANPKVTMSGGTVKNIYGGGYNATLTGSPTITISGGNIGNVYGGGNGGAVTNATVAISGGNLGTVYGGGNGAGATVGTATVGFTNGTVSESIYGGGNGGTVTNSAVNISGGTITKNVFGGGNGGGTVGTAILNVSGGTVSESIYGGGTATINISGNPKIGANVAAASGDKGIVINGGTAGVTNGVTSFKIVGALTGATNEIKVVLPTNYEGANGIIALGVAYPITPGDFDKVIIVGEGTSKTVGEVVDLYSKKLNETDNKIVTGNLLSKNTGNTEIYANGNAIELKAGTTNTNILVGGTAFDFSTYGGIAGDTAVGFDLSGYSIYGGSGSRALSKDTKVTLTSGTVNNIYGGSKGFDLGGATDVTITSGTITGSVYGGGNGGTVTTATVKISGNPKIGANVATAADDKGIVINSATVANGVSDVKIVGVLTGNVNDIKIVLPNDFNGGVVGGVVASGVGRLLDQPDNSKIVLVGEGTSKTVGELVDLFTKKLNTTDNQIVTENLLSKNTANTEIYGNGNEIELQAGTTNTKILVNGTAFDLNTYGGITGDTAAGFDLSGFSIYGGSNRDLSKDTKVTLTSGTVNNIYGGSKGFDLTGSTEIVISGGTVKTNVYGGGSSSKTETVTVTITNGTINGSVFGGGSEGETTTATLNIDGGTIAKNVYCGGNGADGTVENSTVNINGGTISGNIVGTGIDGGTVTNKTLNLSGTPKIGTDDPTDDSKDTGIIVNKGTPEVTDGFDFFNIVGELTGRAEDIKLLLPTEYTVGIIAKKGGTYTIKSTDADKMKLFGTGFVENRHSLKTATDGSKIDIIKYGMKIEYDKGVLPGAGTITGLAAVDTKMYSFDEETSISINGIPPYGRDKLINVEGGFVVTKWNTKADGSGDDYTFKQKIKVTDDLKLYAIWEKPTSQSGGGGGDTTRFFDVKDSSGNGVAPIAEDGQYVYAVEDGKFVLNAIKGLQGGKTYSITVKPNEGYELDYITIDGEKITDLTFTMPNANVDIQVVFKQVTSVTPSPSEKPTPGAQAAFPWWIIIVVGAIVFFFIIILIKRKKDDEEEEEANGENGEGNGNGGNGDGGNGNGGNGNGEDLK